MELDQYSTASGHQSVSLGRNYEMQFPAILGPALCGGHRTWGGGEGAIYNTECLPFYVIMFCFVCVLILPFKFFLCSSTADCL
jgi:hypothetical protein